MPKFKTDHEIVIICDDDAIKQDAIKQDVTRDSHCASCGAWGGTPLGDAYYGINVEEEAFYASGICPMCDGFYFYE